MTNNHSDYKEGDVISGYRLLRKKRLELIKADYFEFIHEKTSARHIHIKSSDSENVFGVAFRTVPRDSTGVAHILEHTALCGSKKYNVRDPFFSMIKRSLNTFMNAFTASDWTMYPYASQNEKDFYNLMGVYLDAAFFPNLDELSFMQEGHRLSVDEKGDLSYQGVVFNEMKGAMSSQSQVMGRSLLNALYPDTTYGFNSGGEPLDIPSLTHKDLIDFHKVHYHPSNSWFFTYGDLDFEKHLQFIDENVLSRFEKIDPGTEVDNQPRWDTPREVVYTYPADGEKDIEKKSQAAVAWLASDIRDSFDTLVLSLLDQIMLGNSAAPLYKALIDSDLGSSLTDVSGYDADNKDTFFAAGLKGIKAEDAAKVEKVIFDTLTELWEKGIDKELIETAVHQFEFHRREITNTPMPYGIKLLLGIGSTWFHGGDPLSVLLFDEDLEKIRKKALKERFFEDYIKKYFLDNHHRVLMILNPDPEKGKNDALKEKAQLDEKRKSLTEADIEKIREMEETLTRLQESREDLSCLPCLEISDISKEVKTDNPDKVSENKNIFYYDKPTSEIFYFTSIFGTGHLPKELMEYVPIFTFLVSRTGTKQRDYIDFTRKVDAVTGGFGLAPLVRTSVFDNNSVFSGISFGTKCLERYQKDMFELISELIRDYSFDDTKRIKSLLLQFRSGLESAVVQNGHKLAISLASRNLSSASSIAEQWSGISQLKLVREITDSFSDKDKEEKTLSLLKEKMTAIAGMCFNKNNYKVCMVGGAGNLDSGDELFPLFSDSLSQEGINGFIAPALSDVKKTILEAWTTQSSVSFVGAACKVPSFGTKEAPYFSVLSRLLKSNFLHREIREKGGAYGGFALYNSEEGIFSCGSYRDPNIRRTIDTFEKGMDFLKKGDFDLDEIKEAILQTASDLDKPDTPAVSAKKDFFRKILNIPDEKRQEFKELLLSTDNEKLVNTAQKYFSGNVFKDNIAVITGKIPLEKEKPLLKDLCLDEKEI
ncbi:MAG: insulinase family protein [Desulfobacteraceae bacterium]|nr:insulinase family protein [Desulfobacteraceae bacterium]